MRKMTTRMKVALNVCIAGFILGVVMLLGTVSAHADSTPTPGSPPATQTVTATVSDPLSSYLAPGGVLTLSIGGIFLIVRELKTIKQMDLQKYKDRAETAENSAATTSEKLSGQITRLEAKLDAAIKDTETKHDLYMAEVTHRRRLELIMVEHGIALPAE